MAPYYRKFHTLGHPSEQVTEDLSLQYLDKKMQGSSGPVQVSFAGADFYGPLQKAWPRTFKNLNFEVTGDPLTGDVTGAYINPCSVDGKTKKRSYAASAYYSPEIASRSNLHVLTETIAEKILFDGKDQDGGVVATSVQALSKNGESQTIKAAKEVLVCAGAIQSPQLLEVSGIGSADLLRSVGVETVVDNPSVGENMQDHALASISFEVNDGILTVEALKDPQAREKVMEMYMTTQSGPLTSSAICSAYMPIVESVGADDRKEITRILNETLEKPPSSLAEKSQNDLLRAIVEDEKDSTVQYFSPAVQLNPHKGPRPSDWFGMAEDGNYMTIAASLSHPFSRGSIHINSPKISEKPTIDPKYLSNPIDLELLARHLLFIETIAATEPLVSLFKKDGRRVPPNARVKNLQEAKKFVKDTLVSTYHPAGTCAMMPRDKGGVVNERLIVYGTKNLRVVDASIMPLIPRGNIQTSVYAIAEKAADMIKQDA